MLESNIEIVEDTFRKLLTVVLVLAQPSDGGSHLGVRLVPPCLKRFVQGRSGKFERLHSAGRLG